MYRYQGNHPRVEVRQDLSLLPEHALCHSAGAFAPKGDFPRLIAASAGQVPPWDSLSIFPALTP